MSLRERVEELEDQIGMCFDLSIRMEEMQNLVINSKITYQRNLEHNNIKEVITTEISLNKTFYYAEDYHQQYLEKNPLGYCGIQGTGVKFLD
jgi:peptide-methionine (S)-S-oxide reductase